MELNQIAAACIDCRYFLFLLSQFAGLVGLFPAELGVAEVAVFGGLGVDRASEVQQLNDAAWGQIEVCADTAADLVFGNGIGAECVHQDRDRLGDADGVGKLDFDFGGQTGGDDVFGDEAGGVGGRTVDFAGVFAGERAAAVAGVAAVGVYDDLAAGDAGIGLRTADDEDAGGVDVVGDVAGDVLVILSQHGLDNVLLDERLDIGLLEFGVVLGGQHNRVNGQRLVGGGVIGDCHLGFGVGAQPQIAGFTDLRIAGHQRVSDSDGQRHQLRGFIDGEPEHHALIARALGLVAFRARVHADGNIGGLLLERDQNAGGVAVKAVIGFGVADFVDGFADHIGDFDIPLRRDFAGDHGKAACQQGFDRDPAFDILAQQLIENSVADLVGQLVRVAFGDRLGRKQFNFGHG